MWTSRLVTGRSALCCLKATRKTTSEERMLDSGGMGNCVAGGVNERMLSDNSHQLDWLQTFYMVGFSAALETTRALVLELLRRSSRSVYMNATAQETMIATLMLAESPSRERAQIRW